MWLLWSQAKTWQVAPSTLLELKGYPAYCLNEAVYCVGTFITNELDKVKGKTEQQVQRGRQRVLDKYLDPDPTKTKGKFADPAKLMEQQRLLDEAAKSLEL